MNHLFFRESKQSCYKACNLSTDFEQDYAAILDATKNSPPLQLSSSDDTKEKARLLHETLVMEKRSSERFVRFL